MKLEFLDEGSTDCPLIRLYGYRAEEVEHLRAACRDLADGRCTEFSLHEQPWVDAIGGCKFLWQARLCLKTQWPHDGTESARMREATAMSGSIDPSSGCGKLHHWADGPIPCRRRWAAKGLPASLELLAV